MKTTTPIKFGDIYGIKGFYQKTMPALDQIRAKAAEQGIPMAVTNTYVEGDYDMFAILTDEDAKLYDVYEKAYKAYSDQVRADYQQREREGKLTPDELAVRGQVSVPDHLKRPEMSVELKKRLAPFIGLESDTANQVLKKADKAHQKVSLVLEALERGRFDIRTGRIQMLGLWWDRLKEKFSVKAGKTW